VASSSVSSRKAPSGMAIQRVAVQTTLGVEYEQIALLGHEQRVISRHRMSLAVQAVIELRHQFFRLFGEIPGTEPCALGDGAGHGI